MAHSIWRVPVDEGRDGFPAPATSSPIRREPELLGQTVVVRSNTAGNQLRATLPTRHVVGPADVVALAVHIMTDTAITGATCDSDGGHQFVAG
jgi:hypothetical protein